ncbi:MAG: hypothetical protein A2X86_19725 [Bdellovibrionales bacterium GWA2_49_15]|nr:MAG: hypothetical protein A2X86_19725 [Bdellovibrionales bacterium GWA2_49_15]HAZ12489.1 hypothetical protein [Bdellovibrionales bacterium]
MKRQNVVWFLLSILVASCSGGGGGATSSGSNKSATSISSSAQVTLTPTEQAARADITEISTTVSTADPAYQLQDAELAQLLEEGTITQEEYQELALYL